MSRRAVSSFALAAAGVLVVAACGGGDDDAAANPIGGPDTTAEPSGNPDATGAVSAARLVWVLDGEPVGSTFDYSDEIEWQRFDAGIRLDVEFTTTGDVGAIRPDLFLPVEINDDQIDGSSTFGPERAVSRPPNDVGIAATDGGFVASFFVGAPLSPISLDEERARAVEFGLVPDEETRNVDDTFVVDVARLLDFPAAPVGGANTLVYRVTGSVEFGNGTTLDDIELEAVLRVAETSTIDVDPTADCAGLASRYLEVLDDEIAMIDSFLLDRQRAFETLEEASRDQDCSAAEFAIPVCEAAEAAVDEGADTVRLEQHLKLCPSADARADDTDTIVQPSTYDGSTGVLNVPEFLDDPAHVVTFRADGWTVDTIGDSESRQTIDLDSDTILTELTAAARFVGEDFDQRAADAVAPDDGWEVVSDETTTIGDRSAQLVIIRRPKPGAEEFARQADLVARLDSARLLHVTLRAWWDTERDFDADLALLLESLTIDP